MNQSLTAIFQSHQKPLSLVSIPIPELGKGEILVKNEFTSLCRSDLNTFCGKRFEKTPTILGHEIVGRICGIGPETSSVDFRGTPIKSGDRISWTIFASDPSGVMARKGIPQKSNDLFKYGHEVLTDGNVLHGGLSQYTILRPNTTYVKIDVSVPLSVASIVNCAVSTVAGAFRLAENIEGKHVLVSGVGMLGIIACAMAKVGGAKTVSSLDINPERLKTSRNFGAEYSFLPDEVYEKTQELFSQPKPFDVVFEFSGITEVMENTINLLAIGGSVIWVGATHPQPKVSVDAEYIVRNLLTIKGLHNYNQQDFLNAVKFIEGFHQKFPFESLIQKGFSLKQINHAFEFAIRENPFRVGVEID